MKTVEVRPTEVTPERIATEAVPSALAEGSDIGVRSGSLAASEDRTSSVGWRRSSKIRVEHLRKLAIVYVRQSSAQQVIENRESTARQYALAGFAKELGWASSQVLVIDEDQGRSGASAEHRTGFQRLLAEVTLDHVGLVLGLEMSRLARSNKDWHHLLELCAIFGTLLADQDGIYDPSDPNDRLLLGLKGTMSEVELHTMRNRLNRGKLNKAKRGELFQCVPMGYVLRPNGEVAFDPDQQAQSVMRLVFATFERVGSIYSLFRELIRQSIELPVRANGGPNRGELDWRRPSLGTLCQVLHHPIYAGAYAYGRRPQDVRAGYARGKKKSSWKPMSEWTVLLKDRLPAYISWEQYLRNQQRLAENRRGHTWQGTVKLTFADSPYNIGIDYGAGANADRLADEKYLAWCRRWMIECARLLTDDGSLWVMINDEYADHFGLLLRETGLIRRSWIKWYETFGVNCRVRATKRFSGSTAR